MIGCVSPRRIIIKARTYVNGIVVESIEPAPTEAELNSPPGCFRASIRIHLERNHADNADEITLQRFNEQWSRWEDIPSLPRVRVWGIRPHTHKLNDSIFDDTVLLDVDTRYRLVIRRNGQDLLYGRDNDIYFCSRRNRERRSEPKKSPRGPEFNFSWFLHAFKGF